MKIKMLRWIDKKPVDKDYDLIPFDDCKCHVLPFDQEKANKMTVYQIKTIYPRFDGECASCGYCGIAYASFAHYIYGDW